MVKLRSVFKVSLLSAALLMPASVMARPAGSTISGIGGNSSLTNTSGYHDDSVNTQYRYRKGVKHFNNGNYDRAYKSFLTVLQAKPQDANANFYMARVKVMRNDHKRAIPNYKAALKHYKGNATILAALGSSYAKINKLDEARSILARLEIAKANCDGTCANADRISASVNIVAFALREA